MTLPTLINPFIVEVGGVLSAMVEETKMTPQVAQEKIERWLEEEGYTPSATPQQRAQFFLLAQRQGRHPMFIFQPAESPDKVIVRLDLVPHDDDRRRLLACDQRHREQFVWDLSTQLQGLGLDIRMDAPVPKRLMIADTIYYDALTKDGLFRRIRNVYGGESLFNACCVRALGQLLTTMPALPPDIN